MTYPDPHYDEYDTCQCPDHVAMREAASEEQPLASRLLDAMLRQDRKRYTA